MSVLFPPVLKEESLPSPHGFFSAEGGVSEAPYESLNTGLGTEDSWECVQENRSRVAAAMGVPVRCLVSSKQTHSARVLRVSEKDQAEHFFNQEGDALITTSSHCALSVVTADCAPVLLASENGRCVGAAHAGWRGAAAGILEATVERMKAVDEGPVSAIIGPCISQHSYKVGTDMRDAVLSCHSGAGVYFQEEVRSGQYRFDLSGFCKWRLEQAGATFCTILGIDTMTDSRFFSHRRATLGGRQRTGRQISVIRALP